MKIVGKIMAKRLLISFIVAIFLFGASSAFAEKISKRSNKNQKLNITSEKVEIIRDKNTIIFTKKVKAVQDKFTLYADKMIVKYKEAKDKKIDIISIKTEKNVKFMDEKVVATGSDGFYDVVKNLITLKNNVKATESGITVLADEFQYDVLTGKTNIIGNKEQNERVTIILDNVDNTK